MTVHTKTVVVVTGGRSAERDRSLLSGHAVHESLARQGIPHSVLDAADPSFHDRIRDAELAFLAISGQWAEDGKLQGLLEHLGVPYTGSGVLASAIAMHKPTAKRLAAAAGIPILPDVTLRSPDEFGGGPAQVAEKCFAELGFPVILKPASEGGSVGMSIAREITALAQRIEELSKMGEKSGEWLVEPFINGTAITCGVIERGGNPMSLPPLETIPTSADFYDYAAKRDPAGHVYRCPANIPSERLEEIADLAIRAHRALSCSGYSRSDFLILPDDSAAWLECNTLPGLSPHGNLATMAEAAGISYDELIKILMGTAVQEGYRP